MTSDISDALTRLWKRERPELSDKGAAVVASLLQRYPIELPDEFEFYLREGAPLADWMDPQGFTWWSPEGIKSVRDECPGPPAADRPADQYLVFADFLVWCYAYAICCSPGPDHGKIVLIGGEPDRFVADDLLSFLELATENSDRLHPLGS